MPAEKATWLHWLLEEKGKESFSDESRGSAWHKTSCCCRPRGLRVTHLDPALVLAIWFRLGRGPSSGQGQVKGSLTSAGQGLWEGGRPLSA